MSLIKETVNALGAPVLIDRLRAGRGEFIIGRWQHGDAKLQTPRTSMMRILLNVGGPQYVRHVDSFHNVTRQSSSGDIGIFPADVESSTIIEGDADIIQVFVDIPRRPSLRPRAVQRRYMIGARSEELRGAILCAFVAHAVNDVERMKKASRNLQVVVKSILENEASPPAKRHVGGLSPGAMRHVKEMISATETRGCRVSVARLAAELDLSTNHFIRAFKEARQHSPYQEMLARRRRRALAMIGGTHQSIGQIADELGFSSPAHFTASFRSAFGVTPSEYRRALAG